MGTDDVLLLKSNERLDNRPFTQLSHIPNDFHTIQSMAVTLCLILETRPETAFQPRPVVIFQDVAGRQQQRLVINHPRRLMIGHPFTLVGFFGQKKEDVNYLPLRNELDQALIAKFPNHPDLLSYSTLELISGNYSNLVLYDRGMKLVKADPNLEAIMVDEQLQVHVSPGLKARVQLSPIATESEPGDAGNR